MESFTYEVIYNMQYRAIYCKVSSERTKKKKKKWNAIVLSHHPVGKELQIFETHNRTKGCDAEQRAQYQLNQKKKIQIQWCNSILIPGS